MAVVNSVWGIDIGQCALKAMKLVEAKDGRLGVDAFEVVEHSNVLSQPDVDVPLIIQTTLDDFLRRVDVSESTVAVSVLGQSSFTRFVKLPPVEKSKIPEIIRFEAEQQIPFPIEEVTWRYQTFQDEDSPEVEAGIFAMKQVDVAEMLTYYANAGLEVDVVQMAPLALYNFLWHDKLMVEDGATLLADVGADKTHLVVSDGNRIWTRTIQIGGNNFTEALVKSFKLSFAKAEKLKRTAAASKYARQIFQVMRPIFADLVQEIQRSIGYYTQLNRESRFKQMVGMGNGFRLPGMQKYLEQNLNMPVSRVQEFTHLGAMPENLKGHVLSLGVAYGLCLQGLRRAKVQTNLLPEIIARKRLWNHKRPWFLAASAALLIASGLFVFRSYADRSVLQDEQQRVLLQEATQRIEKLEDWKEQAARIKRSVQNEEAEIVENLKLRAYSRIWPAINTRVAEALRETMTKETDRQILSAFPFDDAPKQAQWAGQLRSDQAVLDLIGMLSDAQPADSPTSSLRRQLIERLAQKPRNTRQLLLLEEMTSVYQADLTPPAEAAPDAEPYTPPSTKKKKKEKDTRPPTFRRETKKMRGFEIELTGRTPLDQIQAVRRIGELKNALWQAINADPDLEAVGTIREEYPSADTKAKEEGARGRWQPYRNDMPMELDERKGIKEDEPAIPAHLVDPLFSEESVENDIRFTITVRVQVTGDGLTLPESDSDDESRRRAPRKGR